MYTYIINIDQSLKANDAYPLPEQTRGQKGADGQQGMTIISGGGRGGGGGGLGGLEPPQ